MQISWSNWWHPQRRNVATIMVDRRRNWRCSPLASRTRCWASTRRSGRWSRRFASGSCESELARGEMPTAATPLAQVLRHAGGQDALRAAADRAGIWGPGPRLPVGREQRGRLQPPASRHPPRPRRRLRGVRRSDRPGPRRAEAAGRGRGLCAAVGAPRGARARLARTGGGDLVDPRPHQRVQLERRAGTARHLEGPGRRADAAERPGPAGRRRGRGLVPAGLWDARGGALGAGLRRRQVRLERGRPRPCPAVRRRDARRGSRATSCGRAIAGKRNQDAVRALGLLPLPDAQDAAREAEVSARYGAIQEFLRTGRQFGAQRRDSEGLAARHRAGEPGPHGGLPRPDTPAMGDGGPTGRRPARRRRSARSTTACG